MPRSRGFLCTKVFSQILDPVPRNALPNDSTAHQVLARRLKVLKQSSGRMLLNDFTCKCMQILVNRSKRDPVCLINQLIVHLALIQL